MSDSTKNLILRIAVHGATLFVLYALQAMVFPHLRIWNVAPLILPLAVVSVGLFEGPTWGGWFGLAAGILSDAAFSDTTVMFTVTLAAVGLLMGLASEYLLSRGFPSYLVCSTLTLMLIAFFQMFGLLVFQRENPIVLLQVAGLQIAYSLLFALPFYYVARSLGRRVRTV
ncbi:MAG: hypothetical protein FWE28_01715 [Oscillospiraceae bacterium]|nr:hypothetical protein [Oscillospiraceae bacterium]